VQGDRPDEAHSNKVYPTGKRGYAENNRRTLKNTRKYREKRKERKLDDLPSHQCALKTCFTLIDTRGRKIQTKKKTNTSSPWGKGPGKFLKNVYGKKRKTNEARSRNVKLHQGRKKVSTNRERHWN